MRIHRIRVEHVRGLRDAEVVLAPDGVTVVEAPNESGKSSLFDALDIALAEKHTTQKQQVKDLQPVGRDVGSLVEVELSLGDTHLTLRKRFNRDRVCELEIHAPRTRQLAGDEAHAELRRLLDAGTDPALYEALRFRQGRTLDSVALADSQLLARKLDAGAGGSGEPGDDGLLARATAEFERYHTPTGRDGKLLTGAQEAVTAADAEVARLSEAEKAISADADELASLERDRVRLRDTLTRLRPEVDGHRLRLRQVEELRGRLETLQARAVAAQAEHERRRQQVAERDRLVARCAELDDELARAQQARLTAEQRVRSQEGRCTGVAERERAGDAAERRARERLAAARTRLELHRAREQHHTLRARVARIDTADAAAADAVAALETLPLAEAELVEIRAADDELRLALARRGDAAPTLHVRAHVPVELDGSGSAGSVRAGEEHSEPVTGPLRLSVTDVVDVEIHPGTSVAERQAEVDAAAMRLRTVCQRNGVEDRAAAEQRWEQRAAHERVVAERDATVTRELDGLSREELRARLQGLEATVRKLEAPDPLVAMEPADGGVPSDEQLCFAHVPDPDEIAELERAEGQARAEVAQARAEHAELRAEVARLRSELEHAAGALAAADRELEATRTRLAALQQEHDDAQLADAVEAARRDLHAAASAVAEVEAELVRAGADEVSALAHEAEERLERATADAQAVEEQITTLRTRIEMRGGQGIGEALQAAEAEHARTIEARDSLLARAAAAAALKRALEQARESAYHAYREPLRERIVTAGRLVLGDSLDVELDDELRVVTRTFEGVTLPFAQLSAGAREQLAILTALAAADLAGADGVPLVLDDTLGYTDPVRLERLCAVLGRVRGPQVIALTCVGARFQAVGDASVVRLHATA